MLPWEHYGNGFVRNMLGIILKPRAIGFTYGSFPPIVWKQGEWSSHKECFIYGWRESHTSTIYESSYSAKIASDKISIEKGYELLSKKRAEKLSLLI